MEYEIKYKLVAPDRQLAENGYQDIFILYDIDSPYFDTEGEAIEYIINTGFLFEISIMKVIMPIN